MLSQQKSEYSEDLSCSQTQTDQLIEEEFNQIFLEGMDPTLCYLKSYCQLFMSNLELIIKMKELTRSNKELDKKVKEIYKQTNSAPKQEPSSMGQDDKKKRSRRTAGEIARHYTCRYQICQKSYGSEGSLNQHIKLKHNGIPFGQ